jgi:hypothetical protein
MQVTASKMITVNEGVEQLCEDAAHIHCAVGASDKCNKVHLLRHALENEWRQRPMYSSKPEGTGTTPCCTSRSTCKSRRRK